PDNTITEKVFITSYIPQNLAVSILDYNFQVPTSTCTNHTQWHYDQWINEQNKPDEPDETDEQNENEDNGDSEEEAIIDDVTEIENDD
ncbi:MAG: hypothetical protein WBJ13_08315, partial [Sedimentibacter sp.]